MTEYTYTITIIWDGIGIEADSDKELRGVVKAQWNESYNLELLDSEITNIKEVSDG